MGARGKKRVRANGQVASGKQRPMPVSRSVPCVEADQVREGLGLLRDAITEKGVVVVSGPEWQAAYELAQERLHARYPRMVGDAILWRATFLHALIGWREFQEFHRDDGELPTAAMIDVAATIPTYGDETSFDLELFEAYLADRSGRDPTA